MRSLSTSTRILALLGLLAPFARAEEPILEVLDEVESATRKLSPPSAECSAPSPTPFPTEKLDACDNFYRFACQGPAKDDGTDLGISKDAWEASLKKAKDEERAPASAAFKRLLAGPNAADLIASIPKNSAPIPKECSGPKGPVSATCQKSVSAALADLALGFVDAPPRDGGFSRAAYQSELLSAFFATAGVKEVYQTLEKNIETKVRVPELERKIGETMFTRVRSLILKKISLEANPADRDALLAKVNELKMTGLSCYGQSYLKSFRREGAAYLSQQKPPTFGFCGGNLFRATSEVRVVQLMAHEIAHSIDPCNFPSTPTSSTDFAAREKTYAFPKVFGCLRGENSVNAAYNTHVFETGSEKSISPVARDPKKIFCYTDQITESFADWMAAEVLPDYVTDDPKLTALSTDKKRQALANIYAGSSLCTRKPSVPDMDAELYGETRDAYPSGARRMNRILAVNPKIRKLMGCGESKKTEGVYCNSETDPSLWGPRYSPAAHRKRFEGPSRLSPPPITSSEP